MDNQIFRTTLSDRRFASSCNIQTSEKKRWGILFATFFCNSVLYGILQSYGIILSNRLYSGVPIYELLAAPCIFYVSWCLADPWFREAADSWKFGITSRTLAFTGIFMSCLGAASCTIANHQILHSLSFGLLGGLGTSLVLSQINFVIEDVFQVNINRVRLLGQYGRAIGQCSFPYLLMIIFHAYGQNMGYLLVSGCVIQLLPIIMFIKTTHIQQPQGNSQLKSYVRAYSIFEDDLSIASTHDVQLVDLSKKSWKSPSDENLAKHTDESEEYCDGAEEENENIAYDSKIINFVNSRILSQILEESEHESDEESIKTSDTNTSDKPKNDKKNIGGDINRLSIISDKLDEIIVKSETKPVENINRTISDISIHRNDSKENKTEYSRIKASEHSMDWLNDNTHLEYTRNTVKTFSCGCSSYKCYRMKRKLRNFSDYMHETFVVSLILSLKTIQFYPAVLLKVCSMFIPFCLSSLIALLANDIEPKLKMPQIAFVISVHGIAWLIFLVFSPWVPAIPNSKFKYVAAFGCFSSAVGFFVLMDSSQFEFITLGSIITGVGFGAISTTCEETMRNCIGIRKWSKLRGSLDTIAGLIITVLTIWMSVLLTSEHGLTNCFGVLITLLSISGLMWIAIPLAVAIKGHDVQHFWSEI